MYEYVYRNFYYFPNNRLVLHCPKNNVNLRSHCWKECNITQTVFVWLLCLIYPYVHCTVLYSCNRYIVLYVVRRRARILCGDYYWHRSIEQFIAKTRLKLVKNSLKGVCHEIFDFDFFHDSNPSI